MRGLSAGLRASLPICVLSAFTSRLPPPKNKRSPERHRPAATDSAKHRSLMSSSLDRWMMCLYFICSRRNSGNSSGKEETIIAVIRFYLGSALSINYPPCAHHSSSNGLYSTKTNLNMSPSSSLLGRFLAPIVRQCCRLCACSIVNPIATCDLNPDDLLSATVLRGLEGKMCRRTDSERSLSGAMGVLDQILGTILYSLYLGRNERPFSNTSFMQFSSKSNIQPKSAGSHDFAEAYFILE